MNTLNENQTRLVEYLQQNCRGKHRAAKHRELAQVIGMQVRALRNMVSRLARTGNFGIGSFGGGVFWIVDAEDYQQADACLAEEAFPTLERQRALKRWWESRQPQMSLF